MNSSLVCNQTVSSQHSVWSTPFTMPKKVNIKPKSSWATWRQDQSRLLHLRQGNRREAKQKQTATMHTSCIWILLITEYINMSKAALCWEGILFITHVKSQISPCPQRRLKSSWKQPHCICARSVLYVTDRKCIFMEMFVQQYIFGWEYAMDCNLVFMYVNTEVHYNLLISEQMAVLSTSWVHWFLLLLKMISYLQLCVAFRMAALWMLICSL